MNICCHIKRELDVRLKGGNAQALVYGEQKIHWLEKFKVFHRDGAFGSPIIEFMIKLKVEIIQIFRPRGSKERKMPILNNNENLNMQNENSNSNDLIKNQLSFTDVKHELRNLIDLINKRMKTIEEGSIWVVDRFEENFAICENRETKEIRKLNINQLPENLKEGNVLKLQNNKYELDLEEQQNIEKRIAEKMKNIWND